MTDTYSFQARHLGVSDSDVEQICSRLGVESVEQLLAQVIPANLPRVDALSLPAPATETEAQNEIREKFAEARTSHSMLGLGFHPSIMPAVIRRMILENPGWYTAYTPYQAEIAQGRLEMLLNFQQMISDLTGLAVSNASLLDEASAAGEAMAIALRVNSRFSKPRFLLDERVLPQSKAVVKTRAKGLGVEVVEGSLDSLERQTTDETIGVLVAYTGADGDLIDLTAVEGAFPGDNLMRIASCDLLSLALLESPGQYGFDMALGTAQRFGLPMAAGGPHPAFLALTDALKRHMPGRIIGVAPDSYGNTAYRMALQTREQQIRRERATSNICTAQVLPANLTVAWAMWHGADGIKQIARQVHGHAVALAKAVHSHIAYEHFFDTICVEVTDASAVVKAAAERGIDIRAGTSASNVVISFNECTTEQHVAQLIEVLQASQQVSQEVSQEESQEDSGQSKDGLGILGSVERSSDFLTHPVFSRYKTEFEMMRYLHQLAKKDLALDESMISLGSCTMKLNAASQMEPLSWPELANVHPYAPKENLVGYEQLASELGQWLSELTGFDTVSFQPNAGSQGEFSGLLAIRKFHEKNGESSRNVCLIPRSAHGTNPASAVLAGFKVVVVDCDESGNISLDSLQEKIAQHRQDLAAIMVTYPSTHGVFEEQILELFEMVHEAGGKVYLDGANFNAMLGLVKPAELGADVCHLNLHKTFCIPHGGGGPGVGPVCMTAELAPFAPQDPMQQSDLVVSSAPLGNAGILPISWMYCRMMGEQGLAACGTMAILNANYMAMRLKDHFPILYTGAKERIAHECVLDVRTLKAQTGVKVEDIAKRLMDYGFHAPTISFPVAETMMVEPTESESLEEMDRFCEALIAIRAEIQAIADDKWSLEQSPLVNAPHTITDVLEHEWSRAYSRNQACLPGPWQNKGNKYWPAVNRIDAVAGDRNLVCTCPPLEAYVS